MRRAILLAVMLVAIGCSGPAPEGAAPQDSPALAGLIEALKQTEDPAARTDVLRKIYAQGPEGKAFLVSAFVDPDLYDMFVGSGDHDNSFAVGWQGRCGSQPPKGRFSHLCSLSRVCFEDVRDGQFTHLTDLEEMVERKFATDDAYIERYIRAWQHFVGFDKADCADELVNPESTPGTRRLAHRYLRDHEGLDLPYDPRAPVAAMPAAVRQRLQAWKEANYEGSNWQWWDQRQLVRPGFMELLKNAKGQDLENLAASLVHSGRGNFTSDPGELRFGCLLTEDEASSAWGPLLESDSHRARACRELWDGHSRRYSDTILEALAQADLEDPQWKAVSKAVERSLAPESIRRELEEGDFAWGACLAGLRPHPSLVPLLLERLEHPRVAPPEWAPAGSPLRQTMQKYLAREQQSEVLLALGRSKDPRARGPLLQWLRAGDPVLAGDAAEALGYLGDASVEPELLAALNTGHGWIKANVCWALGRIGKRRAVPALRPLAADKALYGGWLMFDETAERAIQEIEARDRPPSP